MRRHFLVAASFAALAAPVASYGQTPPASGENIEQVRNAVLNLIRALVDQGVLSAAKAQEMLRQSGMDPALLAAPQTTPAAPAASAEPPKPVVRVPYVPEVVKDQLREEVKQEVLAQARAERWGDPGALPAWLSRINIYGDMLLRYEIDSFAQNNAAPSAIDAWYQLPFGTTKNDTETFERLRVRARLGIDARLSEEFKAGVRVLTAQGDDATTNPVSYPVQLGRFGRPLSAAWDLAYLEWDAPYSVQIKGGRIQNPYFPSTPLFSGGRASNPYIASDLIWAPELTFDGIAAKWSPNFSNQWSGTLTLGAHPLRVSTPSSLFNTAPDQWLFAAQGGTNWKGNDNSRLDVGASYYYFDHLEGELNPINPPGNNLNGLSAPQFRQFGNTMFNINFLSNPNAAPLYGYASKFHLLDASLDYQYGGFDPVWMWWRMDWVRNLGFDAREIANRIGPSIAELPTDAGGANGVSRPRVLGYLGSFQFGSHTLQRFGNWQVFGGYRYLERDAVPDAFTSADYRLGGTDVKASFVGLNLGISPAVSLTLRYISAESIDAVPKLGDDTWFFDLYGRF
jgi:hypothetical protein